MAAADAAGSCCNENEGFRLCWLPRVDPSDGSNAVVLRTAVTGSPRRALPPLAATGTPIAALAEAAVGKDHETGSVRTAGVMALDEGLNGSRARLLCSSVSSRGERGVMFLLASLLSCVGKAVGACEPARVGVFVAAALSGRRALTGLCWVW